MNSAITTLAPRDLLRVQMADDPQISPAGTQIAWVHTWIDAARDGYRSAICISDVHTGALRRLIDDGALATHPRWSPDGRWLAFLTTQPPGSLRAVAPQLCLVPADGGKVRTLTQLGHGFAEPVWSPTGDAIAGTTWFDPAHGLAAPADADEEEDPYVKFNRDVVVVRRRTWKMDGFGYLGNLRRGVICVSGLWAEQPAVELLAGGEYDLDAPVWSPDGTQLAAVGNLDGDANAARRRYIYLLDAGTPGQMPRKLAGLEDVRHSQVAWSPDGTQIALSGHDDPALGHYGNQQLWLVDVAGGAKRCITAQHDWTLGHAAYTDIGRYAGDDGLRWLPESRTVLALRSQGGEVHLVYIDADSGETVPVTAGDSTIAAFSIDAAGKSLAALVREPLNPGDIFVFHLDAADRQPHPASLPSGQLRVPLHPVERDRTRRGGAAVQGEAQGHRVTAVNQDWLEDIALARPEKFQFECDGVTIDAWILPPPARQADERVPAVLYTGGGPAGMRAANFLFEYQLLAANGYALIFCNSRGCQGYGQDFCTAILGAWGTHDYADNMRCLDEACARFPFIDPARLAIAGGSYGGYLVNWAIGHTDRFRAAISDRSVFNRHSSYGTSDIGHLREFEFGDAPPWENGARYRAQSPLSFIGGATTPTLVVHSAQDLRCAVEQGEQLYLALKQLGVPTKLIRFPNESHGLSRGGRPWHRVFRLECYLEWLERFAMYD